MKVFIGIALCFGPATGLTGQKIDSAKCNHNIYSIKGCTASQTEILTSLGESMESSFMKAMHIEVFYKLFLESPQKSREGAMQEFFLGNVSLGRIHEIHENHFGTIAPDRSQQILCESFLQVLSFHS